MNLFRLSRSSFECACFSILLILGVYVMLRCSVLKEAVSRLLPGIGEPRWLEQSMISFVLTLWVCRGLLLSVTVFIWLPLFFDPLIFGVYVMFLSERGSSAAPPRNGWTPVPRTVNINCVLNLVACLWQVLSVTIFIWMRLIFHSFDFACLRDVPFLKRLLRSPSQEWVNPGASSSQWLALFWLFEFAVDFFGLWRSFFEWAYFSSHLILRVSWCAL